MKNIVNFIIKIILFSIMSIYLSCVVNQITITTNIQFIFIFIYFFIAIMIMFKILRKKFNNNTKVKVISIICACFVLIIGYGKLIPYQSSSANIKIEILDKNNMMSEGNEVWINKIIVNGNSKEPVDFLKQATYYENKNGSIYSDSNKGKEYLEFRVQKAHDIKLKLGAHQWSGMINLKVDKQNINTFDLYSKKNKEFIINIPTSIKEWDINIQIILYIGVFLWSISIFLICFEVLRRRCKREV